MPLLYSSLGMDELYSELMKYTINVENLAPDSVLFNAEERRLTEEIKILNHKIKWWDTLIKNGRTITPTESNDLYSERNRIYTQFQFLQEQLKHIHQQQQSYIGPNGPFGNGNDTIYSNSESEHESSTSSPRPTTASTQIPIPYLPLTSSSVSSVSSSSSTSFDNFQNDVDFVTSTPLKPPCCRKLHFSRNNNSTTINSQFCECGFQFQRL